MAKKTRRTSLYESGDPRLLCIFLLRRWEEGDFRIDELFTELADTVTMEARDRGLLQEILFGIIRYRGRIDYLLNCFLPRGLSSLPAGVRETLRLGAYQILFSDRIPAYAAINETVRVAKELRFQGMAGLINAVLRRLADHHHTILLPDAQERPIEHMSVAHSFPEWLVERFVGYWGRDGAAAFMREANRVPDLFVRTNTLRITPDELPMRLESEGIAAYRHPKVPTAVRIELSRSLRKVRAFREGLFQVQSPSAQLVAPLLGPRQGEVILDACAAPGGKTTHLVELLDGVAGVIAVDRSRERMRRIAENLRRLHIPTVVTHVADLDTPIDFLPGKVMGILLDAPCSGLGVLQRRPDLRWKLTLRDIEELAQKQLRLLENLEPWLAPGGKLVYSTCTITPEENRNLVRFFLKRNPAYHIASPLPYLPESVYSMVDEEGFLEVLPHRDRMDGMFAVRLEKGE